jgi:nucleoside-diphosphate-sugar epimerase
MFHRLFDVPVVIARVFMTYGPGQQNYQKLIPYVTLSFLRGEAPRLTSGQRLVDWIYVEDVVEGFLAMACVQGINGQTVDLGTGKLVSVRDVVSHIRRTVGTDLKPEFNALPDRAQEEVRAARVDHSMKQLGWKARTPLNEGLRRTVAWLRSLRFEHPAGTVLKVVVATGVLSFLHAEAPELASSLLNVFMFCTR